MISRRLAIALALGGASLFAQTAPLAFEVASIKPAEPLTPEKVRSGKMNIGMKVDGARVDIGFFGLRELIIAAYEIKPHQLTGPDWMSAQRFDIQAKIPAGVPKEKVPEMLQTLLKERFGLKFHRDSKELNTFALVVGKGGHKMKEAVPEAPAAEGAAGAPAPPPAPGAQTFSIGTAGGPANVGVAQVGGGGATITASGAGSGLGGPVKMNMSPDGTMRMEMSSITMPAFAAALERFVDKPVVDQTELKGNFQVALDMTMADMMSMARSATGGAVAIGGPGGGMPMALGGAGGGGGVGEASDPAGGSVFASVQKLGLKLEPRKSPAEMLVVDSLEKNPTEN